MELDIKNFLPKYPNIEKFREELLNPYDDNFYEALYKKKEFYDERLPAMEVFPEVTGTLMKHQKLISRFFSSHTLYDQLLLLHEMGCVDPETPIPLWNGHVKRAGDIEVGDELIGDDGQSRKVLKLVGGEADMFRVDQLKADSYTVNGEHILTLKITGNLKITWTESRQMWSLRWFDKIELRQRVKTKRCFNISKEEGYKFISNFRDNIIEDDILEIKVQDYLKLSKIVKDNLKGYKCNGINWSTKDIGLDPYLLGMWLGYGYDLTSNERHVDYWEAWSNENKSVIKKHNNYVNKDNLSLKKQFLKYNLINNKHIPIDYIINDNDIRLKVLAGIIDVDGYDDGTCIEITHFDKELTTQICYLVRSLGFSCNHTERKKICLYKGEKKEVIYQLLTILGEELHIIPTLTQKVIKLRSKIKDPLITQIKVRPVGIGRYVGWQIGSNKRFLLGDLTVTHNSGKTCSAIGAIEKIKSENEGFLGAMIFARGEGLLNNFINELVFKCTGGQYIPEEYNILSELEKVHRIKKITKYYNLNTFETFAKTIKNLSNKEIESRYSNRIIVIDEVHNLRIQDRESGVAMYQQFHRFLHTAKGCKILLMSGTPMKDGPEEIASVMNLILPEDEQLPVTDEFKQQFFETNGEGLFHVKPSMVELLKSKFKGRVSYLKAMQSDVKKIFEGSKLGNLKYFNVVDDKMSSFQTVSYNEAYRKDTEERVGIYNNSRQASLFVYPDGTYGPEGFNNEIFIKKFPRRRPVIGEDNKKKRMYLYVLGKELQKKLESENEDDILNNLEKYSSMYTQTIRSILSAYERGESSFVYCEFVQGSGAILFSLLLSLFGFSRATGNEPEGSEKKRYAIITNITSTQKEIKKVINRFNRPDNMYGKVINIVIGSRVIGEGFSLKNIQNENILTPHWNCYLCLNI
jgi:hypothetical protein